MRYTIYLFLVLTLNSAAQTTKKYGSKDENQLYEMTKKWEHYWNIHNMDSMGTLLKNDVDFVTVTGTWLKGKKATVAHHKKHHNSDFKSSVWTTDSVAVKYIKSDLALLHIKWGMKGDFDPDGTPRNPRHGVFSWLVVKQNNEWLLLAVHNVNVRETPVK
jgi:uncharacterized protein (TIGR02246 family)